MSIVKTILLVIVFQIGNRILFAQKIIDSIRVCGYPVKEGIIYQYDENPYRLHGYQQDVSILTNYDSVFHIRQGEVIGIHFYDGQYAVIIRTNKDECFCYSNLRTVNPCKGDIVQNGTFLGLAGKGEEGNRQQVNFMLIAKNKNLPFKKTVGYIRCKTSGE